ncbi:MarR family winged helix-turn-helix transcriptional regulator [Castellaniella sp.]|uniref:MarR family winged helix-turn-helix transcriptional regulator n=1 Tax=Castellaniella sp. TaxID=1955812 RepID=UPI00356A2CA7
MNTHSLSEYDQEVSAVHNRLFFRVFQVANTLERQAAKELGITTIQWSVLGALSRAEASNGMPFSELAEYLVVSRQNLDGVLKRLERDEHVRRIPDPCDRRVKLVLLTSQGSAFWSGLQPKIYEFYRQSMKGFRFDDKVSFVHFINRLNNGLKAVDLSSSE